MVKVYHDEDVDLSAIASEMMGVIGYGNQGRAQALSMRESGLRVLVGCIRDETWDRAEKDGFKVLSVEEAAERGDCVFMLIPDEVQSEVHERQVLPHLTPGKALVFAHGYNIHYGFITPPGNVDVILVAPMMIGAAMRELFLRGSGAPTLVGVHQDATGRAWKRALAIAKALGATKAGAVESSFREETELDHFGEQVVAPAITRLLILSFEVLVEAGYTPEAAALELYASGEASEVMKAMAEVGLFKQLSLHSQTSQYGTLSRAPRIMPDGVKDVMMKTLEEIQTGVFAREWEMERRAGYPVFKKLKQRAFDHPINEVEQRIRELVRRPQPKAV